MHSGVAGNWSLFSCGIGVHAPRKEGGRARRALGHNEKSEFMAITANWSLTRRDQDMQGRHLSGFSLSPLLTTLPGPLSTHSLSLSSTSTVGLAAVMAAAAQTPPTSLQVNSKEGRIPLVCSPPPHSVCL